MFVSSDVSEYANSVNLEDFESNSDESDLERERKKQLKNLRRNKEDMVVEAICAQLLSLLIKCLGINKK